jgi:hypothetical protein
MNYFTPERLVRLQDHSDEQQFLAALDEWERAQADYREQLEDIEQGLRAILRRLPENLRTFFRFLDTVSLHDARVLVMTWGGDLFRVILHPESQKGRLVVLTYSLEQPPQIQANVLPEQLRSEPISWLYDEVAWDGRTRKGEQMLRHTILLSDGSEVVLRFADVTIERPVPLVLAVPANCA